MSDPEKDYHFELVAGEESLCATLEKLLEKSGLPVHMHQRKGKYVVYLKGCQHIADMLTLMGASAATMELENIRIKKEIRNQVNRAMNCDEKNAERQVSAAQKQVEMIKAISIQRGLYTLPPSLAGDCPAAPGTSRGEPDLPGRAAGTPPWEKRGQPPHAPAGGHLR